MKGHASCCILLLLGGTSFAQTDLERLRALAREGAWAQAESLGTALVAANPAGAPLELAELLNFLSNLHLEQGELPTARAEADSALAVRRRALPADDLLVAASLHLLGTIARRQAELLQARAFYEESLAIRERRLGAEHVDIAWSLNNLANVLYDLGEFAKAAELHRRALAMREQLLGPEHPDVAFSLNNLANAMMELGDTAGARPLLERSLTIREKALGPAHVQVAQSLNNLALAYGRLGDLARADSLYARSVSIRETALGPDHPEVARSLLRQSYVREALGHDEEALAIAERALELRRKGLGPEHPEFGLCHMRVAQILTRQGRIAAAAEHALAAEGISRRHFTRMVRGLDEGTAFSFSGQRTSGIDLLLELCSRSGAPANMDSLALDALIRSRSLILDELMTRQRVVASAADPRTQKLAQQVMERQAEVARLALDGPLEEGEAKFLARLGAAEVALAEAQRVLAERGSGFGDWTRFRDVGLSDVVSALPKNAALVCLARYGTLGPPAIDFRLHEERYVAFVLSPRRRQPLRVELGAAVSLDQSIATWLELLRLAPNPLRRSAAEQELRAAGLAVRAMLFDPIAARLGGVQHVFVVPDADLASVPLAALPDGTDGYLVEGTRTFHLLGTERELLDFQQPTQQGKGLLVLGGIETALAHVPCAGSATTFAPLPGSLAEADVIAAFWRTSVDTSIELLRGGAASEAQFRRLSGGRRAIHLATHGFFLDADCLDERGVSLAAPYRGGIVLSVGAGSSGPADPRDDGWLTAAEIAGLDLFGTEWAVLSACRSGQGEVVLAGEEMLGLRRALRIAGVATVITSLWDVEDAAAREWMTALYEAKWKEGLSTADAMREASLTVLRARRMRGQSDHPSAWANFIAMGDWR